MTLFQHLQWRKKCIFVVLPEQQQQNGHMRKHELFLIKVILNDDFVENQFQIALIIHRSIDNKFQSCLLHSKAIKEGFHFATLKWHRLTCYLNWAILIGDLVGQGLST